MRERSSSSQSPPRSAIAPKPAATPWITVLTLLAPVYMVIFALTRSFLEMAVFARGNHFSYYTGLHHLGWYVSTMLAIVLTAHFVLREPVTRLLWLMYGITLTAMPLAWSAITGKPLAMEYLTGSWTEVVTHVLTFCLSYERNWPLVLELLLIFAGMLGVGWVYTRSWRRALLLAVSVHLVMAVIGQAWFSAKADSIALVSLSSRLARNQPLQAACWVGVATLLTLILMWRAGAFDEGRRSWAIAAVVAGEIWIAWTLTMLLSGRLPQTFDAVITGLPVATAALLAGRLLRSDRGLVSLPAVAVLVGVLVAQLLVVGPVAAHKEHHLLRPRQFKMPKPRGRQQSTILPAETAVPERVALGSGS